MSDEQLSFGIRSIAAPVRDASGRTIAAVNVTVNAAETSIAVLKKDHLPLLLSTAAAISSDFSSMALLPTTRPLTP
jgi:IclR family pca regulon transcriptional regulator